MLDLYALCFLSKITTTNQHCNDSLTCPPASIFRHKVPPKAGGEDHPRTYPEVAQKAKEPPFGDEKCPNRSEELKQPPILDEHGEMITLQRIHSDMIALVCQINVLQIVHVRNKFPIHEYLKFFRSIFFKDRLVSIGKT